MENFENYTNSELLTMLLDGEFEAANEAELFRSLADDPELQQQMEYQLAMKEAVKNDTEAFTPPVEATTGLFDKLGYAVPAGIPAVTSLWNSIFNKRAVATAALLLIGTLSVTGIMLIDNDDNAVSKRNISIVEPESGINLQDNDILAVNNVVTDNDTFNKVEKNIPVVKNSAVKVDNSDKNNNIAAVINNSNENNSATVKPKDSRNVYSSNINFVNSGLNYSGSSKFDILRSGVSHKPYNYNNFDVSSRNNSVYIRTLFSSGNHPMNNGVNNIAIGYLHTFKNDFSFGLELGSQSINRLFTDDFSNQLVTESKDVLWYAINLRYDASNINVAGIAPFAQVRFGLGTDFNYMMGGNAGLVWNNESLPFAVSASYNYTNFRYTHLSNSYNFDRSALNIGVYYKF